MINTTSRAWARPVRALLTSAAAVLLAVLTAAPAMAQHFKPTPIREAEGWTRLDRAPAETLAGEPFIRPEQYTAFQLDRDVMRTALGSAAMEVLGQGLRQTPGAATIMLPTPEGTYQKFLVVQSPVMEQELQDSYPEIRTYLAQGVTDPTATARIHDTPEGFGAQVMSSAGVWYVDRLSRGDDQVYASYRLNDARFRSGMHCLTKSPGDGAVPDMTDVVSGGVETARSGNVIRRFRVAIAATGEYSQAYGGGTPGGTLSAVVQTFNRIVGIYEQELSVRLVLIGTNDRLIFTDPLTDPYPDHVVASDLLNINTGIVNTLVGRTSYDVGHVMSSLDGSGVALLNVVCGLNKAAGVSLNNAVPGSAAAVFLTAHEMGHQFGAEHTFNGLGGGCGPNRSAAAAYETGSGVTLMSYVAICGTDNVENTITDSNLFFHSGSFDLIISKLGNYTCAVKTTTGNRAPVMTAMPRFVVPINNPRIPFVMVGQATDPDGDALTYTFDQRNLGDQLAVNNDDGIGPVMRSFAPTASRTRTYPRLATILGGPVLVGEPVLTEDRFDTPMKIRVTARDNRAGNGAVNTSDSEIALLNWAPGFSMNTPANPSNAGANVNIVWNNGFTDQIPQFGAERVRIRLSADGGQTFPFVLNADTENDGTQQVTLPVIFAQNARVKIEPLGNIFFAISNNFTLRTTSGIYAFSGQWTINDAVGNGNGNGRIDPGELNVEFSPGIVKRTGVTGTNVVGTLTSLTPTVEIVTGVANYPDVPSGGTVVYPSTPFVIRVLPNHPCGAPIQLQLAITSTQGNSTLTLNIATGDLDYFAVPQGPFTYTYSGPPVAIRDPANGTPRPANVTLAIGDNISITQTQFRFNGSRCSTQLGSSTVGLEHSSIGHLTAVLRSPSGVDITLFSEPGGTVNRGNNMCNTILRDSWVDPNISTGTFDGVFGAIPTAIIAAAPYTGTFTPDQSFQPLVGTSTQGNWRLTITDNHDDTPTDRGNIRSFSLIFYGTKAQTCPGALPSGRLARLLALTAQEPNPAMPAPEPLTADDITEFLYQWSSGDLAADIACVGGELGKPDGELTADDLIAFFNAVADSIR